MLSILVNHPFFRVIPVKELLGWEGHVLWRGSQVMKFFYTDLFLQLTVNFCITVFSFISHFVTWTCNFHLLIALFSGISIPYLRVSFPDPT